MAAAHLKRSILLRANHRHDRGIALAPTQRRAGLELSHMHPRPVGRAAIPEISLGIPQARKFITHVARWMALRLCFLL